MKKAILKVQEKVLRDPELAAKVIVYGAIVLAVVSVVAAIAVRT